MQVFEEESDPIRLQIRTITLAAEGRKTGGKVRPRWEARKESVQKAHCVPGGSNQTRRLHHVILRAGLGGTCE